MQEEPIEFIDFDALREHVANYEELFHKLLRLFLEQAPLWISEINAAFANSDSILVRQICHKIKGGAGTLHAKLIIEAAADLNGHAVAGDLATAEESRARLVSAIDRTIAYVQASGQVRPAC